MLFSNMLWMNKIYVRMDIQLNSKNVNSVEYCIELNVTASLKDRLYKVILFRLYYIKVILFC